MQKQERHCEVFISAPLCSSCCPTATQTAISVETLATPRPSWPAPLTTAKLSQHWYSTKSASRVHPGPVLPAKDNSPAARSRLSAHFHCVSNKRWPPRVSLSHFLSFRSWSTERSSANRTGLAISQFTPPPSRVLRKRWKWSWTLVWQKQTFPKPKSLAITKTFPNSRRL